MTQRLGLAVVQSYLLFSMFYWFTISYLSDQIWVANWHKEDIFIVQPKVFFMDYELDCLVHEVSTILKSSLLHLEI